MYMVGVIPCRVNHVNLCAENEDICLPVLLYNLNSDCVSIQLLCVVSHWCVLKTLPCYTATEHNCSAFMLKS